MYLRTSGSCGAFKLFQAEAQGQLRAFPTSLSEKPQLRRCVRFNWLGSTSTVAVEECDSVLGRFALQIATCKLYLNDADVDTKVGISLHEKYIGPRGVNALYEWKTK